YWAETLAGAPELLELPTDHPRPAQVDHAGELLVVELDEALTAGLKALSRRHGTTLFMTVLAGWAVVLSRLAGRDDVVVGTPVANRGRRELEGLIGFFVNTLALRVDLSGAPTVAELLARVKERALSAQHHQDIPFEQVVERVDPARSLSHTPLFQAMFTWQDTQRGDGLSLPGLQVGRVGAESSLVQAKVDLSLTLRATEDRILGSVTYATALFERETVERWAGYLRRVLEEMAADEHRPVERLALLGAEERARVLDEWNRTETEYPREACVHQLFEAQAARTPDAEAVVWEGERLTYAGLNARANRLAHHLRALGVGPDVPVGICVERSLELLVSLLALLKAGGAYVALDPDLPDERLRTMLEDSRPAVLLAHASLSRRLSGMDVPVLAVDADAARWAALPETNPEGVGVGPDHLVYVIYTSGSTGRPKGVMNTHRNVVNRIAGIQHRWRLEPGESVLQVASLSFDVSAYELFWPLMLGARVVLTRPDGHRDPAYLVETIRRYQVGTASFVPSSLQVFLEQPGVEECASLVR
ncbi:MAG TPA: AMP-binding protein, partial [Longimicrobium sp.]|nr:AMP-binding protein [Longimicrobium sp.]